jgi:ribose/xylose/arabinose/galactoside ABC-type transport system permease subunit
MSAAGTRPASGAAKISSAMRSQQSILALLVAAEIGIFARTGQHFFSAENFLEVSRLIVPLGLLALAQTPVILTGGIDLSVGSLLGLCAVVFGKTWRDMGCSPAAAGGIALLVGAMAGSVNALLITWLRIPPLIVTLGSYSLFRGLAIAITGGSDNYTNFPDGFLYWGQGSFAGGIPTPLPFFIVAAVFFWLLVHRSAVGRALAAIGYSPQGARHAGIPVNARTGLVYVLSGLASGAAAIFYVAHFGQATADAGMEYELKAITAVVLGGTSIFGGRASITGTLLGLFAIALLQNGLELSEQPAEMAGILTGLLLLAAIGLDLIPRRRT